MKKTKLFPVAEPDINEVISFLKRYFKMDSGDMQEQLQDAYLRNYEDMRVNPGADRHTTEFPVPNGKVVLEVHPHGWDITVDLDVVRPLSAFTEDYLRQPKHGMFLRKMDDDHHYAFWCPACNEYHTITIDSPDPEPNRSWTSHDHMSEAFTVNPSVRVSSNRPKDDGSGEREEFTRCHLNITAGKLVYHSDSPHELSGQTIPMTEEPDAIAEEQ